MRGAIVFWAFTYVVLTQSELIGEGVAALRVYMTSRELDGMSHAHPTFSEALKEAAMAVHKEQIHL